MHLPGVGATMNFIMLFIVEMNIAWWLFIDGAVKWQWRGKPAHRHISVALKHNPVIPNGTQLRKLTVNPYYVHVHSMFVFRMLRLLNNPDIGSFWDTTVRSCFIPGWEDLFNTFSELMSNCFSAQYAHATNIKTSNATFNHHFM